VKDRDPILYLTHVLESIELASAYVEGVDFQRFSESQQLQDAVIRRVEIIGEAVKNLPAEIRDAAPDVPWRRIAGMRDKIVHDYMGVDIELIWAVVQRDLPRLARDVRGLVAQQRSDEGPA